MAGAAGAALHHGTNGTPDTLEASEVRALFNRISGAYDLLNDVISVGMHHSWRKRAADVAAVGPGDRVLDVAAGTGDLTIELSRRVSPGGEVIGCDFSEGMLEKARAKAPDLRFELADALALPYTDDEFDASTVGFGARNFSDLELGLSEMARVVRPGGHVVVLDFTSPTRPLFSMFFRVWFDRLVPALGRIGQQGRAYSYLAKSVRRYPSADGVAAAMSRCGLSEIRYIVTGGGIVTIHAGLVTDPSAITSAPSPGRQPAA
jgi:demethylmenaquinone methyltransferase/2-methoxy-6-polyprenyl-1,4-benzoquinol methylase